MNTKSMKTETIFIFYYYYFLCQEIQKNFILPEENKFLSKVKSILFELLFFPKLCKKGYKNQKQPSCSISPGSEHSLANLASQGILSEKLRFSCFSQVPAGSDYPYPGPIRMKAMD